ncbi:hypothetical protein MLD38_030699 [Melastoma candidum]|uniref:Uncharacterized protein n=1 Tax=Melastoma candidum TaxID=119954 RepID=A0ACB9MLY6_9MYRT|nr:hypothetical protein MLD38_030699 [Melastoma candidum]
MCPGIRGVILDGPMRQQIDNGVDKLRWQRRHWVIGFSGINSTEDKRNGIWELDSSVNGGLTIVPSLQLTRFSSAAIMMLFFGNNDLIYYLVANCPLFSHEVEIKSTGTAVRTQL